MDFPIRPATAADFTEIAAVDSASFGSQITPEELADVLTIIDPVRFLVATDDERIVGVTGDFPFTMTVPGATLDVAGVTWVSVDPTRRRRGILRELMRRQLRGYAEAGVAAAVLTASEGGIYGRFGYGAASRVGRTAVDRRRATLARAGDAGAVQLMSSARARERMPRIHERWRAKTPGALSRTEAWWDLLSLDREYQRGGMSGLFHLVHADGYVSYRVKSDWGDGDPKHMCWLVDYVTVTAEAHAALWQVLLGMDLFGSVGSHRIPVDDPFIVGGEELMFPGDPNGSPGNVINCRCFTFARSKKDTFTKRRFSTSRTALICLLRTSKEWSPSIRFSTRSLLASIRFGCATSSNITKQYCT